MVVRPRLVTLRCPGGISMAPSLMQQCVSRRRGALGIPLCIPMVCIGVFVYTLMRVCIYTQWSLSPVPLLAPVPLQQPLSSASSAISRLNVRLVEMALRMSPSKSRRNRSPSNSPMSRLTMTPRSEIWQLPSPCPYMAVQGRCFRVLFCNDISMGTAYAWCGLKKLRFPF